MAKTNTLSELANLKTKLCEGYTTQIISHMVNAGCITKEEVQDHYAEILSILSLGKTGPNTISFTKKMRRKKKKDPNAPKRPANAYLLFKNAKYQEIKDALADEGVEITIGATAKRASTMWKALSKEDKKPYEAQFIENKTLYQEELASYKASNPEQEDVYEVAKPKRKRKKKSKVAPCPSDIPAEFVGDWIGPFVDTFLCGSVKGIVFSTLDEALTAANERTDCVGVTRSNRGYSIRFGYKDSRPQFQGTGIKDYENLLYSSPTNETSFLKKTAADNYKTNGPNEKPSSSSDESVQKTIHKKHPKKTRRKSKFTIVNSKTPHKSKPCKPKTDKKQPIHKTPPAQLPHESDTEDSSAANENDDNTVVTVTDIDMQSQDTKLKVNTITLGGTNYLLDSKNKVYDFTTHEFVGKFENGSINFDAEDSESEFSE